MIETNLASVEVPFGLKPQETNKDIIDKVIENLEVLHAVEFLECHNKIYLSENNKLSNNCKREMIKNSINKLKNLIK